MDADRDDHFPRNLLLNIISTGCFGEPLVENSDYEGENDPFDEINQEKLGPTSKVELDEEFFIIEDQPPNARRVDIGKGFCKKMWLYQ